MMRKRFLLSVLPVYIAVLCGLLLSGIAAGNVISTLSESAPVTQRKCIIIDPGHGGEDGGAISCTGVSESAINLEIALRLEDLMHLLGIKTLMIRTTDCSVYTQGQTIAAKKVSDLKERVRIVNSTSNALLISIHQNKFSDGQYSGAQVFYAQTPGSEALAKAMQSTLIRSVNPGSRRMAKKADGVYLMKHAECTGILVECGFLSNPEEEAKLRSASYQKKLCCVMAAVCSSYAQGNVPTAA